MQDWLKSKLEISHGSNSAIRSIEGLRGLAVFLVFWVHYASLVKPWVTDDTTAVLEFVATTGKLGVDLFFVISGYLIYGTLIGKKQFDLSQYTQRRIMRIYPTFLVVFIAYIALSLVFPSESKLPQNAYSATVYILQNLLLLPGLFDIEPIITVAWSLSYEVFYYIAIPCMIYTLRMHSWRFKQRVIFWIAASALGFSMHFLSGGHVRLLMFISGILLYELSKQEHVKLSNGGTRILLIALISFGLKSVWQINNTLSMLLVFILFLLACLCALNTHSRMNRWLVSTPIRWLGNMSYSYYLLHGLTLKFAFLVIAVTSPNGYQSGVVFYWLWLPLFIMTLLTSLALFIVIEQPLSLKPSKPMGRNKR